jgi:two-component system, response regulator YesN
MYRLLIVEDEKWEREGLRDFIDWESMGIELAGAARDGEEGLKLAEEIKPDIVIADIRMPRMDGLRMSKLLRERLSRVKIIILSGYDDFLYAKQAIGLHASAYILKPVEKAGLEEALRAASASLDREGARDLELGALERRWGEYVLSRKDHALFDSLEGGDDSAAGAEELCATENAGARAVAFAAFYRRRSPGEDPLPCSLEADRGVREEIGKMIRRRGARVSFGERFYEAVLLMEARGGKPDFEAELRSIADEIQAELGLSTISSLGDAVAGDGDLFLSYAQARAASSYRFACGCGEVLAFSALSGGGRDGREDVRALILAANEAIEQAKGCGIAGREACRELVDDFLSGLARHRCVGKMLVEYFILEAGRASGAALDADLGSLHSLDETRRRLYSAVDAVAERTAGGEEGQGSREGEIVRLVQGIVEKRYAEELDLALLSEEVRMSPYYLGSLFKKRTGKNFSRYLAEYRLEAAREMLKERDLKLDELSDAIGIHNPSYLCALFKKRFGVTPSEYRRIESGRS